MKRFLNLSQISKKIFRAALLVGIATIAVKVLALGKEIVVASAYGTSGSMDAFLLALMIPMYLMNVLSGSCNVALVPAYVKVREQEGEESAAHLLSTTVLLNILVLAGGTFLLLLFGPILLNFISRSASPETQTLLFPLYIILIPTVLVSSLSAIFSAIINTREKFFFAALIPGAVPVIAALAVIFFSPAVGIYALAAGTLGGFFLEMFLVFFMMQREQISFSFRWQGLHPAFSEVLKQYIPVISGSCLMCSAIVIDQTMAVSLGEGSVATLGYGNKIISVALSAGTLALGTAILPYFSKMIAQKDWKSVQDTLSTYSKIIIITTIPLTLLLIFFSEPLIRAIFERGAFTTKDTLQVSIVQAVYALQIPAHTLGILFVRILSSLQMNHLMLISNIISITMNIVLNLIFMKFFGVAGIALSTVGVYTVAATFLGWCLFRKLSSLPEVEEQQA